MNKTIFEEITPPILLKSLRAIRRAVVKPLRKLNPNKQDLSVYWDTAMANILETWGEKNVWKEIQLVLADKQGKVLDIACGTGKTMQILSPYESLEIHGCDISDMLIDQAVKRGITEDRLKVCDATNMPYEADSFDYSYSIGSLEHFSLDGIQKFLSECHRVTAKVSYHQIPISRSGIDHGWIKTYQSYHNNSVKWWLEHFHQVYAEVYAVDSTWEDDISVGKWFVCIKN
ncbi:class I SAM-dependent methyltransferase [Methylophilus sp. Leaf414]|uniref:class I SAM-dependent methyltransferase n=1 Tax=Methylophilus sp. Leaf414 TaxID=1736371 RepID=UPI0006F8B135|nr:class I SAM-dependent methyltransferase [Methylophilus sp. Leaf414]KQT34348.1 methyltransferase type 11 [Methylophilus sp. Leaf414]